MLHVILYTSVYFNFENKNNFYIFSKFNQIKIILSTFYKKQDLSTINKSE